MSKHAPIAAVLGCAAAIMGIAGVGPILSIHTDGPGERAALVSFTPGD